MCRIKEREHYSLQWDGYVYLEFLEIGDCFKKDEERVLPSTTTWAQWGKVLQPQGSAEHLVRWCSVLPGVMNEFSVSCGSTFLYYPAPLHFTVMWRKEEEKSRASRGWSGVRELLSLDLSFPLFEIMGLEFFKNLTLIMYFSTEGNTPLLHIRQ